MDSRNGNSKFQSYFSEQRAIRTAGAYGFDNLWRVLGIPIGYTVRKSLRMLASGVAIATRLFIRVQSLAVSFSSSSAATVSHVFHVLTMRSDAQMIRANASPIIAGMQNHHSRRDRAMRQFIRTSMRSTGDEFCSISPREQSVSICKPSARPFPAL